MSTRLRGLDCVAMLARGLVLAGAVALAACAPPTTHIALDARPPLRSFATIGIDADDKEILMARVSSRDTTWQTLTDVVEIGGRVVATIGDTLVVQPYYLTRRGVAAAGPPATIYRGGPAALPDLVLIPMTPRVSIGEFRTPTAGRPVRNFPLLVLGGLFILTVLVTDVGLLFSL